MVWQILVNFSEKITQFWKKLHSQYTSFWDLGQFFSIDKYIWDTCSRNGTPCKICRRIPQKHFSLTPINPLILNPFGPGLVSFFHSWVGGRNMHKKLFESCPKNCFNSGAFWSKIKGVKKWPEIDVFYTSNGFCSHLHNFHPFLLKLQILIGNELKSLSAILSPKVEIIFFKIPVSPRSEKKNISDKIKNSLRHEKSILTFTRENHHVQQG